MFAWMQIFPHISFPSTFTALEVKAPKIQTLLANEEFKNIVASKAMPRVEYLTLKLRPGKEDELDVQAKLLLPPELDPTHITQYPLLLYT